jgi:CheY-specific phosphatase CheX
MNPPIYQQILFDTARRILQEAAFAFIDQPAGGYKPGGAFMACSVAFNGPFHGAMALAAGESLAATLAANMLGVDESDPDADQKKMDALGEILNMICGNVLPEIAGARAEFAITAPEPLTETQFENMLSRVSQRKLTTADIVVEGCDAHLALIVEQEDPATP